MRRKIALSILALVSITLPAVARAQLQAQQIVLTGGPGWNTLPFAYLDSNSGFMMENPNVGEQFEKWAATPGVQVLVGSFRNVNLSDIALVGIPEASFIPLAESNGDGTFTVNTFSVGAFGSWAAQPGVKAMVGDFNGDGHADIALVGGAGWNTVPVALWNASGGFTVTNYPVGALFQAWAAEAGVHVLVGDFNGDGKSDIALVGGPQWASVPVAFSNGDGTFRVTNDTVTNSSPGDFARWAATPGVQVLMADFNWDGKSDIALVGGTGWASVPVAFSNGDGTFRVTNDTVTNSSPGDFARWAATAGVRALVGNFTYPGVDMALVGGSGWNTVPVAHSNGDGTFTVSNTPVGAWFQACAAVPGVHVLVGDFNHDGYNDIALLGGAGWNTIPVAFGGGNPAAGSVFAAENVPAGNFAALAAQSGVKAFAAQVFPWFVLQ